MCGRSVGRCPELDHQDGAGVSVDEGGVLGLFGVGAGQAEDGVVHHLAHEGPVGHGALGGAHGRVDGCVMDGGQTRTGRGQGKDTHLQADGQAEGAFGAGQQCAQIIFGAVGGKGALAGEEVEGVARIAALDAGLGKGGADGPAVVFLAQ